MFQVNHQTTHHPLPNGTEWITYQEGVDIYKLYRRSPSTFNRDRASKIRQKEQPDKKRVLYSRADTERLARQKSKIPTRAIELFPAVSGKATPGDMPELATLIKDVFKMDTLPDIKHWQSLMRKNPDIGILLREGTADHQGRVVGCGYIFPHTESWVQHILDSEVTPKTRVENILPYEPGTPVHLYLRTIGITPEVSGTQKKIWAAILVRRIIKEIEELGHHGILVEKLWSKSDTTDGKAILRHMGFTRIESHTSYHNFVIDVATSGLPIVMHYKRAYQGWQKRNSSEAD